MADSDSSCMFEQDLQEDEESEKEVLVEVDLTKSHWDWSGENWSRLPTWGNESTSHVTDFNLSACRCLTMLPSSLGRLQNLKLLSISGCSSLRQIPPEIGDLVALEYFNCQDCTSLQFIPSTIGQLLNLQTWEMDRCHQLQRLPDTVGKLCQLRLWRMSACFRLTSLPNTVGDLQRLELLDLECCKAMTTLPDSLRRLRHCLRELHMEYSPRLLGLTVLGDLEALSSWAVHFEEEVFCPHEHWLEHMLQEICTVLLRRKDSLRRLEWVGWPWPHFPSVVGELHALQHFQIVGPSPLQQVPPEIGQLRHLQTLNILYCSHCRTIPPQVSQLTSLKTIDFTKSACLEDIDQVWRLLSLLPPSVREVEVLHCEVWDDLPNLLEITLPPRLSKLDLGYPRIDSAWSPDERRQRREDWHQTLLTLVQRYPYLSHIGAHEDSLEPTHRIQYQLDFNHHCPILQKSVTDVHPTMDVTALWPSILERVNANLKDEPIRNAAILFPIVQGPAFACRAIASQATAKRECSTPRTKYASQEHRLHEDSANNLPNAQKRKRDYWLS